jgi:hypothetical protein
MKNYNNYINENIFTNFLNFLFKNLKEFISKPLNDFTKEIKKNNNPKDLIKSLKTYIQITSRNITKEINSTTTTDDLEKLLKNYITGLYAAIDGIKKTEKINPTYFQEIFKNSDKDLIKLMSYNEKIFSKKIDNYINNVLMPGLYKISNIEIKTPKKKNWFSKI